MSALARLISALSTRLRRNGQSRAETGDGVKPGLAMDGPVGLEGRPEPVPAGQVDPRLRPGEGPRDGPQAVDRRHAVASSAGRRPRAEPQVGQLRDRGDVAKERGEARIIVDERPISLAGGHRLARP